MIRVARAPAYATVQDLGRYGFVADGVPRAGAMDTGCLETLNAMLGNDARCAGIEWALTGGALEFTSPLTFATGGAAATCSLSGRDLAPWRVYSAVDGETLEFSAPTAGRFGYIAVAGGVNTPPVMGSRSTYVPGSFGGHDGRRLKTGDQLPTHPSRKRGQHHVSDPLPVELLPETARSQIRYIARGGVEIPPQWRISASSDRTGYRLESESGVAGASITSEPVCPGVIQLPPGGQPIVLMADAPTVGGYLIAGSVISADLGALAQRVPGDVITLEAVTIETAERELRRRADRIDAVREWRLG